MKSPKQDKKEAIKEYLEDTEVLVTKGRIRLDIINNSDVSISSSEIEDLMEELVDEGEVEGYNTSSKGPVYRLSGRDLSEFEV